MPGRRPWYGAAAPFLSSQPQLGSTEVFLLCSMVRVNDLLANVIRAFPRELLPPTLCSHRVLRACACNRCGFCFNASQHQRSAHLPGSASAAVPACPVLPMAVRLLWLWPHLPHSPASPQFCPHTVRCMWHLNVWQGEQLLVIASRVAGGVLGCMWLHQSKGVCAL